MMPHYKDTILHVEQVSLLDLADNFGTPCYVYSRQELEQNWLAFNNAFTSLPHRICYAVKANSNLAILNLLARLGSGFDTVSIGEIERVIAAGGDPQKIIFSGVGKTTAEISRALEIGIFCFNVESVNEIERLHQLAKKANKIAAIALRINPNIDANTHPYIATGLKENKFGIAIDEVLPLCKHLSTLPNLKLIGIACHIGSQLTQMSPFLEAVERILDIAVLLQNQGISLQHINLGGGLGIRYQDETPPSITDYATALSNRCNKLPYEIIIEPGRAICANAGILLTRIEYLKPTTHKNFIIIDAAMNDLMRPALYQAWQPIKPVILDSDPKVLYDIVGPVCESADFLGRDRLLAVKAGDLLAICCAGAYGFSMSSNYNSRPRVAEVMVDRANFHLIRQREVLAELFANEVLLP